MGAGLLSAGMSKSAGVQGSGVHRVQGYRTPEYSGAHDSQVQGVRECNGTEGAEGETKGTEGTGAQGYKGCRTQGCMGAKLRGADSVGFKRFKCNRCTSRCETLRQLNKDYREKHCKVRCAECGKVCKTPSTLRHHAYEHMHGEWYRSKICNKTFVFMSYL